MSINFMAPVTMSRIENFENDCEDECCTPSPLVLPPTSPVDRKQLVRDALRLEWITIGWMVIEAVVAIGSGFASSSLVLLAFGLDSIIEVISAGVLMWRLTVELRKGEAFSETTERVASRIGAILLFALAVYVVIAAGWNLWSHQQETFSLAGFLVTLFAIPIMRYLATKKLDLANQLGSRALRADAIESVTCGWLSVVSVVSLGIQAISGIWWIDSVGSLTIVWLLVKEAKEAWTGECCVECE
jgi:divalent metal cation (Fe/Co/Zn/Cd) transporter